MADTKFVLPTPAQFFDPKEIKVLQALWALSTKEWVTLPGPSEWWPDVTGDGSVRDLEAQVWYRKNGFDLPGFSRRRYRKAMNLIMSKRMSPPHNWQQSLLRPGQDLVWKHI